jgi:hypothetical protein
MAAPVSLWTGAAPSFLRTGGPHHPDILGAAPADARQDVQADPVIGDAGAVEASARLWHRLAPRPGAPEARVNRPAGGGSCVGSVTDKNPKNVLSSDRGQARAVRGNGRCDFCVDLFYSSSRLPPRGP